MSQQRQFTPKTVLRYAIQGVVLAVLATTGVVLFYTDPSTFRHLSQVNWVIKIGLLAMVVLAWLCNGMRVLLLTRSMGYRLSFLQSLSVSLSSEFGIAATPAGMGGPAIRLTLLKRAGIPLTHGTSMLAMDVALDFLFFLLLIPFAIVSLTKNTKIRAMMGSFQSEDLFLVIGSIVLVVLVPIGMLRIGAIYRQCHRLFHHSSLVRYRLPSRIRLFRWKAVSVFRHALGGFVQLLHLKWGSVGLTFCCASLQWICRYSILPLLLYGLSIPCDPILLFLLQGLIFMGSMVVVLPGGGGGVELTAAIILRQIIPPYLVGVVILLWRFFTYHLYLLGGGSMFLWTCTRLNRIFPTVSQERNGESMDEEITFDEPVAS